MSKRERLVDFVNKSIFEKVFPTSQQVVAADGFIVEAIVHVVVVVHVVVHVVVVVAVGVVVHAIVVHVVVVHVVAVIQRFESVLNLNQGVGFRFQKIFSSLEIGFFTKFFVVTFLAFASSEIISLSFGTIIGWRLPPLKASLQLRKTPHPPRS